jgi:hypothetical protein
MFRRLAISPFTFTFSPVKNLSSMGFPTIFMFMWIVVIAFCWLISTYRLLLLLQSTKGINVCVTPDLHSVPFPKVENLESSLHFHRLMSDYVPVHKQRKMFGFYLLKKVSIHRRIQFKYRSMKYTIYLIAKHAGLQYSRFKSCSCIDYDIPHWDL